MTRSSLILPSGEEFIWYPDHVCWGGYLGIHQTQIPVSILPGTEDDPAAMQMTEKLTSQLITDEAAFRDFIAAALLSTYNDEWHEMTGDGPLLTKTEFTGRLSLNIIRIQFGTLSSSTQKEWFAELEYDADDMFAEHTVSLFVDENIHFSQATIG